MKSVIFAFFVASLCLGSATAQELGSTRERPFKKSQIVSNEPPAAPMQGGDTIEDALEISLPFSGSGTTVGFANDYDEQCPWTAHAPDVVYSYFSSEDIGIVVDLWGSDFDTKLFILNENLLGIACNDDFYDNWVSRLEMVTLSAGTRYYIIVDGFNESGNYEIQVYENQFEIPPDAIPEGEPTMYFGYVDEYNSGCNYSIDQPLMQEIIGNESGELVLHGHSGWMNIDPLVFDTDWFSFVIGETGTVYFEFIAQIKTHLGHLEPLDCNLFEVSNSVETALDSPVTMTVTGPPFSVAWVAVWPRVSPPSGYTQAEFSYLLSISGLQEGPVAIEQVSWGAVKSLYR